MSNTDVLKSEILDALAPCGLNCRKCIYNSNGEIRELSSRLKERLGNFAPYAERFAHGAPVLSGYKEFSDILDFMSEGDCRGCRHGGCKFPGCNVLSCTSGKGIDFCYQCGDFPCEKSGLQGGLKERWISMNSRMKGSGAETYYKESMNEPRYV